VGGSRSRGWGTWFKPGNQLRGAFVGVFAYAAGSEPNHWLEGVGPGEKPSRRRRFVSEEIIHVGNQCVENACMSGARGRSK